MKIIPEDDDVIECYVCGDSVDDMNAITVTRGNGIVGCVFACSGECVKQLNGAMFNMDHFIISN